MPRDGSNVYHRPSGIDAVTNTTISSTAYNTNVQDVEADLNLPRPIVAGGTGATNASAALTNLGGEQAKQVVTNYSATTFVAGSFYSAASATGAPVAGHAFSGICYLTDANNMFLEARDQDDTMQPGTLWVRQMKGGVWSAWSAEILTTIGTAVPKNNVLINGDFRINQMGYASAAALASGAYGHDQWKAGAGGGDYSFTQLASSTQITIASGKSLIQPIEAIYVSGGSYVLSWTGTAQARAGVNTLTPSGSYAASPLLIAGQTAGTNMSVEFNAGTLGTVKLESGTVATPFVMKPYDQELAACRRYYEQIYAYDVGYGQGGASNLGKMFTFATKRISNPNILTIGSSTFTNCSPAAVNPAASYMQYIFNITASGIYVIATALAVDARM